MAVPPTRPPHDVDVFPVMRRLHELLWYLAEALTLPGARPLQGELRRAYSDSNGSPVSARTP